MPSLTRNATPNNDSTTPTFTGTLPVVNQRHTFVRNTSNGDSSNSLRTAGRGARTAGAASAVAKLGGGALGRGGGAGSGAGGSAARGAAVGAGSRERGCGCDCARACRASSVLR